MLNITEQNPALPEYEHAFRRGAEAVLRGLEVSHEVAVVPAGMRLADLERFAEAPRRLRQALAVRDLESFRRYLDVFGGPEAVIFADENRAKILAVLDYHQAAGPQWCEHRVCLALEVAEAWEAWKRINGQVLAHGPAAEFLEERSGDIIEPDAATVLEVAQGLQVDTAAKVVSVQSLSGAKRLQFEESEEVRASAEGIEAPEVLTLSIPVFQRFDDEEVRVRLFYRVRHKALVIGFRVLNADAVERAVFDAIVETLEAEGRYVLRGWPEEFHVAEG